MVKPQGIDVDVRVNLIGVHQERTQRAAMSDIGAELRNESSGTLALWQIAHSLAVIADALERREINDLLPG